MSLALYNIAQQYRAMVEALVDSEDDARAIFDTIEAESGPLKQKIQRVAYAPKILEAEAQAIEERAHAMLKRAAAKRARAGHILEYLKTCMEIAGITSIDHCTDFLISITRNPVSVDVWDERQLPAEFLRQPPAPPTET